MSSLKGGPIPLPTEAEIEAQAIREREASRREAERILTQEASQRRAMEERILAMKSVSQTSLPAPQNPSAAAITPTGSPRKDKDDGLPGWWSAAKTRLTPTKELTPAQQIIQETKVKNKTEDKVLKKRDKEKKRPTVDPNLNLNLNIPEHPPTSRPNSAASSPGAVSNSNVSSNPILGSSTTKLSILDRASSPNSGVANASKDSPPLYAKFDSTGRLDIPETLLAIARRFEKLERWAVGHVRALEDRVGDIEKWLVDKEDARQKSEEEYKKEKESWVSRSDLARVSSEVSAVKEGLSGVKARVVEMGRTTGTNVMAYKPASGSSGSYTPSSTHPPAPMSAATSDEALASTNSRTRLPYPTGDYASPGDPGFSPPASPPPRVRSPPTRSSFAGALTTPSVTSSGLSAPESSTEVKEGKTAPRRQSVSPTPRKRYTVALGGPLTSPLEQLAKDFDPSHPSDRSDNEGGFFSSAVPDSPPLHAREDTIGGTPINLSRLDSLSSSQQMNSASSINLPTDGTANSNSNSNRTRAQSSYGAPAGWNDSTLQSATPPLRMRRKSGGSADAGIGSTGGLDTGKPTGTTSTTSGKFVDPLIVRKKEREGITSPRTPGRGRTVGELAAFFDGEK
jgi:hypothetical protein